MNNVQGQAARKAHKAQHCWPPCKEVKASNKNWKVNGSAVCFLCNIFFCVFYNRSLYCFKLLFSSGKSGWLWKEPVVEWCGKWPRRQHHMRCSKWPLSAWTQVSSLVRHWSMIHHALLELTPCLDQLLSQIDFFCISLGSAVIFFNVKWGNL